MNETCNKNFDEFSVHIKPLYVKLSKNTIYNVFNRGRKDIYLREFQYEFFKNLQSDKKLIIINSPTGSGKTLCSILASKFYNNIICLYPTKELIYDQAASIYFMLKYFLDITPAIFPSINDYPELVSKLTFSGKLNENDFNNNFDDEYCITILNSDIFEAIRNKLKEKSHREGFKHILKNSENFQKKFFIMSYDLINLLVKGEYSYSKTVSYEEILNRIVENSNFVFLDEFHVWEGLSLSSAIVLLCYFLSTIGKITISSATFHPDVLNKIKVIAGDDIIEIQGYQPTIETGKDSLLQEGNKMTQIKCRTILTLINGGDNLYSVQDNFTYIVKELMNKGKIVCSNQNPFLVIVDRIIDSLAIYDIFKKFNCNPILKTGFSKPKLSNYFNTIIGNYSFELGVDIKNITHGLIFGKNSSSIIQRIGRIGRNENENITSNIILVVDKARYELLTNKLSSKLELSYDELIKIINEYYTEKDPLIEFALSTSAVIKHIHFIDFLNNILNRHKGLENADIYIKIKDIITKINNVFDQITINEAKKVYNYIFNYLDDNINFTLASFKNEVPKAKVIVKDEELANIIGNETIDNYSLKYIFENFEFDHINNGTIYVIRHRHKKKKIYFIKKYIKCIRKLNNKFNYCNKLSEYFTDNFKGKFIDALDKDLLFYLTLNVNIDKNIIYFYNIYEVSSSNNGNIIGYIGLGDDALLLHYLDKH